MSESNSRHNPISPPPALLPVLQKVKSAYLLWFEYYQIIPKAHRHTLGQQIDTLWIEVIKTLATASFLSRQEKIPYVRLGIQKVDTLKILLMILWEAKSLQDKKYIALSIKVDEIGRMLGGWSGQLQKQLTLEKQNSPKKIGEK